MGCFGRDAAHWRRACASRVPRASTSATRAPRGIHRALRVSPAPPASCARSAAGTGQGSAARAPRVNTRTRRAAGMHAAPCAMRALAGRCELDVAAQALARASHAHLAHISCTWKGHISWLTWKGDAYGTNRVGRVGLAAQGRTSSAAAIPAKGSARRAPRARSRAKTLRGTRPVRPYRAVRQAPFASVRRPATAASARNARTIITRT